MTTERQATALLAEIVAWNRIHGMAPLKAVLQRELRTANDYLAYEATNGARTQAAVGKQVGITGRAVGYKWEAWRALGIIFVPPGSDYPRHLLSASALGIEPPGQ